jgi:single-stranded-DNA-specific exonuclease
MSVKSLRRRAVPKHSGAWPETIHPVLRRIYAARGATPTDIDKHLQSVYKPTKLGGVQQAIELLVKAIKNDSTIVVAGDYDCDGATGTAVGVRGLRMLGAKNVSFTVPNRFLHGYGLSPALIDTMQPKPDVIVTVDSGIASLEGVRHAKALGITVIVTDHHLPGEILPDADAIVNPNVVGDEFPSKALAGVGVMFYLLWALRQHLENLGTWKDQKAPSLIDLLDLVALGTVADLVVLDQNNRILVDTGIRRIRAGLCSAGIKALVLASGRDPEILSASDIGFSVAPRLNAAGRLENMSLGVEALLTDDFDLAVKYVEQLDAINQERRDMQAKMTDEALEMVFKHRFSPSVGVVVFSPTWHAGIIGLISSKIKENLHRPTFAFAPAGGDSVEVRGSGRSIEGFHLRDALVAIDTKHPGMILKFGGHAMAAGLSLLGKDLPRFSDAFDELATQWLTHDQLQNVLLSDGELRPGEITVELATQLRDGGPWGQGFPEPIFDNVFECVSWTVLKEKHFRLELRTPGMAGTVPAIWFSGNEGKGVPPLIRAAYRLGINSWKGRESLQLMIQHVEAA